MVAGESPVEDVLRVFVGLEHRVQQRHAVVQVFAHAPLLHADDAHDLLRMIEPLDYRDVHFPAAAGTAGRRDSEFTTCPIFTYSRSS